MGDVWKWVIQTVSLWPPVPVPFLLAAIIVGLLIISLVRKAFKSEPRADIDRHETVDLNMPWGVLTQLVIIDKNTQDILHHLLLPDGRSRLDLMSQQISSINKLLRRQPGRSKKLSPIPDDDDR